MNIAPYVPIEQAPRPQLPPWSPFGPDPRYTYPAFGPPQVIIPPPVWGWSDPRDVPFSGYQSGQYILADQYALWTADLVDPSRGGTINADPYTTDPTNVAVIYEAAYRQLAQYHALPYDAPTPEQQFQLFYSGALIARRQALYGDPGASSMSILGIPLDTILMAAVAAPFVAIAAPALLADIAAPVEGLIPIAPTIEAGVVAAPAELAVSVAPSIEAGALAAPAELAVSVAPVEGLIPIAPSIEAGVVAAPAELALSAPLELTVSATPLDTLSATLDAGTSAFDAGAIPEAELAPIPESVITPTTAASFPSEVASSVMDELPQLPQIKVPSLSDILKYGAQKLLTSAPASRGSPLPHQVAHATLTERDLTAQSQAPNVAGASPVPWVILGLLALKAIL
jgi:hypothetical protein